MLSYTPHGNCPEALRRIAVSRGHDPGVHPINTSGDGERVEWPEALGDPPSQAEVDDEIAAMASEPDPEDAWRAEVLDALDSGDIEGAIRKMMGDDAPARAVGRPLPPQANA